MARGTSQPDVPLNSRRVAEIRASIEDTRQYYAANSGGEFDLTFPYILDVVIPTEAVVENGNTLHRRVGDAWEEARRYVRANYPEANVDSAYVQYFDVSGTSPDAGQGWSGISFGNNVANQENVSSAWGQTVSDHELGHRIGVPHASALRSLNEDNYTPYVWDVQDRRYEVYNPEEHGFHVTTYGINQDAYGNPFDIMGNINVNGGHLTVHEKLTNSHWLNSNQVRDLESLRPATYRIYAHDELEPVYDSAEDVWGVEQTYGNRLYGLTYQRPAQRFDPDSRQFELYDQTITLEYRSGRDGLQFYLDDFILDVDPEDDGYNRNSLERELEVGQSIEDIDFGTSVYFADGDMDDFLSYDPPAPDLPWQFLSQWYDFEVQGLGSDSAGSYVEVAFSIVDLISPGDFNQDGRLNNSDVNLFRGFWNGDTSAYSTADKFAHGDMDFSGVVDIHDLWLLSEVFAESGVAFNFALAVPEPSTVAMLFVAASCGLVLVRRLSAA
ncbi:PEP-CTERM sorting domain-containing protein [Aeoliella straminimaris]|uniref:PEP-CTERM sorting domain-containing protein n=1 Tax=Aeoliella straminimaris TaxID=2954799 RepID=UPI002093F2D4